MTPELLVYSLGISSVIGTSVLFTMVAWGVLLAGDITLTILSLLVWFLEWGGFNMLVEQ